MNLVTNQLGIASILASVFAIVGCTQNHSSQTQPIPTKAEATIRVGFITVGPSADSGFNESHARASHRLNASGDAISSTSLENIPENAEAERAIEKLINQNNLIIFATSYGHLDAALKVAKRHPQVKFMHCGGHTTLTNLGTYSAYIHEPMFLAGMVAGRATRSNRLGFVAANRIPQVYWSINAFTLGVRSVNSDATVHVVFTNSWNDPALEAEASEGLIDTGVDVLAMHLDSPMTVVQTAEKHGVFSVGIHMDVSELAPKGWLTGAVWHWDDFYREVALSVKEGSWKSETRQLGLREGIVDLATFGPSVTSETIKEVTDCREKIVSGKRVVFHGPVIDNQGRTMLDENVLPTQQWLDQMDWFVAGVNR